MTIIGMLWFSPINKTHTAESNIVDATRYFVKKYGFHPTSCSVHRGMELGELGKTMSVAVDGEPVSIIAVGNILPSHYYLYSENQQAVGKG